MSTALGTGRPLTTSAEGCQFLLLSRCFPPSVYLSFLLFPSPFLPWLCCGDCQSRSYLSVEAVFAAFCVRSLRCVRLCVWLKLSVSLGTLRPPLCPSAPPPLQPSPRPLPVLLLLIYLRHLFVGLSSLSPPRLNFATISISLWSWFPFSFFLSLFFCPLPFGLLTFWPFGLLAFWPYGLLVFWPFCLLPFALCSVHLSAILGMPTGDEHRSLIHIPGLGPASDSNTDT